jgi:kelch-like protein 2/3
MLATATPYFKAMFFNFAEGNKDLVNIGGIDSTILQLLIDYIYTGEIMITQENVQVLLYLHIFDLLCTNVVTSIKFN